MSMEKYPGEDPLRAGQTKLTVPSLSEACHQQWNRDLQPGVKRNVV